MWRRDPALAAVVDRGAVSVERMRDCGPLTRSFGKDLERPLVPLWSVPDARPHGDEAAEGGEPLRSAECREVLVEHLFDGRHRRRLRDDVGDFGRPFDVQRRQVRRDHGAIVGAMARVARHHLPAPEVGAIDFRHHQDHSARRPLSRIRVGGVDFPAAVARRMAILAGHSQGCRKDPHRPHELVHGNSLEHLNILEDVFRHLRFLTRPGLAARQCDAGQPHHCHSGGRHNHLHRAELHRQSLF